MTRRIILIATVLGFFSIVFGAFGAHALKAYLDESQLVSFETAVRYQMYHALFLLFVARMSQVEERSKKVILYLVLFGVLFFSGSIYLLTTISLTGIDFRFLGPITPIGGFLLLSAWTVLFLNILKRKG
jgi:uncharacterized membrane protein YgdD (TMEM256/DUF423 family)